MKVLALILIFMLSGCASGMRDNGAETQQTQFAETELGSFYTPILDTEENRVNNIILSARVIDGVEVKSGETFSFNNTVGGQRKKATRKQGY